MITETVLKLGAIDKMHINKTDILKEDTNCFPLNEISIVVFTNMSSRI